MDNNQDDKNINTLDSDDFKDVSKASGLDGATLPSSLNQEEVPGNISDQSTDNSPAADTMPQIGSVEDDKQVGVSVSENVSVEPEK